MPRFTKVTGTAGEPGKEDGQTTVLAQHADLFDALLPPEGAKGATVTRSFSAKVGSNLYYGTGTWDRIAWTVDTFTSVTLQCRQDEASIAEATAHAEQLAWEGVHKGMHWGVREFRPVIEKMWPQFQHWFDPGRDSDIPFKEGE